MTGINAVMAVCLQIVLFLEELYLFLESYVISQNNERNFRIVDDCSEGIKVIISTYVKHAV